MGSVLIFSDIHADITALKIIFECAESKEFQDRFGSINKVINLGDVVGRGYSPSDVIEYIKNLDYEVVSIIGNHDEAVLNDRYVSGDDFFAARIHDEFKEKKEHWDYFKDLRDFHIERDKNLVCVHGGPIDPILISPRGLSDYEKWLYQRTWQRLDPLNSYYDPTYGFRYTPEMAFEHSKRILAEEIGEEIECFIIFCGHQHREAVYQKREEEITNLLPSVKSKIETLKCSNRVINYSEFVIEKDCSYLVRFGIAGPIGFNFYTAQFGVLYKDKYSEDTKIALIEVDYPKEADEEVKKLYGGE